MLSVVKPYLIPGVEVYDNEDYLECIISEPTDGLKANSYYYNNPQWAEEYLETYHRNETFRERWAAALGNWTDKIIVDVGCGPGNLFATLKGNPKLLIGIDVAPTSLKLAKKHGYTPILADASKLPLISGFADIVTLNATLHHCENMETALQEAARILKPGGLLVTDHDPQLSAWNYKGLAKILWNGRLILYNYYERGFHKSDSQQYWALKCEIHHKPGHGLTKQFFHDKLLPLGFDVKVFPHNHTLGAEVLKGQHGRAAFKYRVGNILSGRNPYTDTNALSLMCVAKKGDEIFYSESEPEQYIDAIAQS